VTSNLVVVVVACLVMGGCIGDKTPDQVQRELRAGLQTLLPKSAVAAQVGQETAAAAPKQDAAEAEAQLGLRWLFDAATAYYEADHADLKGEILPKQFPVTTPLAPKVSCCATPGRITCEPSPHDFEAETWQSLVFSRDAPFHFQYEFVSSGSGRSAKFLARAVGDPTCTGKMQVWEVSAKIAPDGAVVPTDRDRKKIVPMANRFRRVR
jgi:hypothetical protein